MTIPLALALEGVIFAGIAVSGSLIIAVLAIFFAVVVVGITGFVVGLGTLFSSFWTGILYLGMGLMVIGIMIMLVPVFKAVVNGLIRGITLFSKWIYNKIVPKNRAERKGKGDQK